MPLFEVKVRTIGYDFYEVEAKNAEEAAEKWSRGTEAGKIVEDEYVIEVINVFDSDDDWVPEYDDEEEYLADDERF